MFKVLSLPATFGDCFWIQYGDEQDPNHILIDGGTGGTRTHIENELRKISKDKRNFELVVVSHIDNDHIGGFLRLLEEEAESSTEERLGFTIGDLWFNGWPQLNNLTDLDTIMEDIELFGIEQGERLTTQIRKQALPWNRAFNGAAIVVQSAGELPKKTLPGGMVMTILSPLPQGLQKIKEEWKNVLLEAGMVLETHAMVQPTVEGVEIFGTPSTGIFDIDMMAGTAFDPDTSDTNRSSIAVLAEFDGKRALFAADAHVDVLLSGLARFQPNQATQLDLMKISHHGAQGTTSLGLIEAVDCPRYLFSSNGSNYFHPHAEAVSRVIVSSSQEPQLIFNYKGDRNRAWEDLAKLSTGHTFHTIYPANGEDGITVKL